MNKVSRAALAGIIGAVAAGCTAVLGSFEVTSSAVDDTLDANEDATGAVDVQPGDDDAGGFEDASIDDASIDATDDAGVGLLSCSPVRKAPLLLASGSTAPFDGRILSVFRTGDVVRIVALRPGATGSASAAGLLVYTFAPKLIGGGGVKPVITGTDDREGRVLDVQHAGQRISVLGVSPVDVGGTLEPAVVVWESPDDQPAQPLVEKVLAKASSSASAVWGALGAYDTPDQYVYALSVPEGGGVPGQQRAVYYGRWTEAAGAGLERIAGGLDGPQFRVSSLTRSGGSVFIFNGVMPRVDEQGVTGYVSVPEQPKAAALAFRWIIDAGATTSSYRLVAANGLAPVEGMRIAAIERVPDANAGPPSVFLRAGALGPADLPTIDVLKLPRAIEFPSLEDVPADGVQGRFFGNDLVIVGAPLESVVKDPGGVNLVWYDVLSRRPRAMVTGNDRLLKGVKVIAASAALTKRSPNDADVDLVWIEQEPQSNPPVVRLMYDELRCR